MKSFSVLALFAVVGLLIGSAATARAGFVAPRDFDFGDGAGEYEHTVDPGLWTELVDTWGDGNNPTITYPAGASSVRYDNDNERLNALGLMAAFDNLGGGSGTDFTVTSTYQGATANPGDTQWGSFNLAAYGSSSSYGYYLRHSADVGNFRIYKEDTYVAEKSITTGKFDGTNEWSMELTGEYQGNGDLKLTGYVELLGTGGWSDELTWTDTDPLTSGNEFGGFTNTPSWDTPFVIDQNTLTVVPEPSSLVLLSLAGLLLMKRRRV